MATEEGFANHPTPGTPAVAWATSAATLAIGATALTVNASPFTEDKRYWVLLGSKRPDGTLLNAERIHVTAGATGTAWTVERTEAVEHAAGESLYHVLDASVMGGLVTLSGTQTLANKTHTGEFASGSYKALLAGDQTHVFATQTPNDYIGLSVSAVANAGDAAQKDESVEIGANCTGSGKRNPAKSALCFRVENFYKPTGVTGDGNPTFMEAHIAYYGVDGTVRRPLSVEVTRETHAVTTQLTATTLSYNAINGVQYVRFAQGEVQLTNSAALTIGANNVQSIKQLNAAGNSYLSLIYLNATNNPVIGHGNAYNVMNGNIQLANTSGVRVADYGNNYLTISTINNEGAGLQLPKRASIANSLAGTLNLACIEVGGKQTLQVRGPSGAATTLWTEP